MVVQNKVSQSGISMCWRHFVTSKESSNPIFTNGFVWLYIAYCVCWSVFLFCAACICLCLLLFLSVYISLSIFRCFMDILSLLITILLKRKEINLFNCYLLVEGSLPNSYITSTIHVQLLQWLHGNQQQHPLMHQSLTKEKLFLSYNLLPLLFYTKQS